MPKPLRVAILGAGMIGAVHRQAVLLAGARLVGVLASSPTRSAEVAAHWATDAIGSLDELRTHEPDVVHVCSPNHRHAEHVEAALAAGAHVICEKPLAIGREQTQLLRDHAARDQRVATVPFVYRFHPLVREIRARVLEGEFGRWQLLHGSYLQDWLLSADASNWRIDAGQGGASRAFADIGSHWCDLMEFVTGERIASVCAAMRTTVATRPDPAGVKRMTVDTEDVATVQFSTVSGVLGTVTVSQVSAGRKNRLWFEFDGAQKSAVFDQETPETIWLGGERTSELVHRDPARGAAEQRRLSSLPAGHAQGYAQCFHNFVADTYAAVRGEAPEGLPTFTDGLRAACIIDAVVASARSRRWVDVPAL